MASAMRSLRSPAPRIVASRVMWPWSNVCWRRRRSRCLGFALRHALADVAIGRLRSGQNRDGVGTAQQLLRQTRGLSLPRLRSRRRSRRLLAAGAQSAARSARRDRGCYRRRAERGRLRRRRLFGAGLGDPAAESCGGLCQIRNRAGVVAIARRGGRAAHARLHAASRGMWPAPGASAPRSCRIFGARVFVKTGAEGIYCGALPGQSFGHRNQMRRRRKPRRAGDHSDAVIARFLPMSEAGVARRCRPSCGRFCATGTASRSGRCASPI